MVPFASFGADNRKTAAHKDTIMFDLYVATALDEVFRLPLTYYYL